MQFRNFTETVDNSGNEEDAADDTLKVSAFEVEKVARRCTRAPGHYTLIPGFTILYHTN